MTTFYIHAYQQALFNHLPADTLLKNTLNSEYGVISRRASRLSLIALTGALGINTTYSEGISCHEGTPYLNRIPKTTGLYMSSSFSSPSNIHTLMLDVLREKTLRPFNFINSINNAVSFYVAESLGLEGPNLFLASSHSQLSWSKLILMALADLETSIVDTALIGWCHEHKKQLESSEQEGSHWLLLSRHSHNARAKLTLRDDLDDTADLIKTTPHPDQYYYQEIQTLIQTLTEMPSTPFSVRTSLAQKRLFIEPLAVF